MIRYIPLVQWRAADPAVVAGFLRACEKAKASDRIRLALFEAGVVETNLRALDHGDRDSLGPLQQRAGWGSRPTRMDPYTSALLFIADAQHRVVKAHPTWKAARVAQAVQRSAYPTRYRLAYPAAAYVIARALKERGVK